MPVYTVNFVPNWEEEKSPITDLRRRKPKLPRPCSIASRLFSEEDSAFQPLPIYKDDNDGELRWGN